MLSAPPIQASSAGTAHLRSVPRYKSGCNKWFKTICWFRHLFIFLLCNLCIGLFRYFFFSFKFFFLNLLLFMHFCFILCIHLLVTSFQVCIYVWTYSWKSVFNQMFFHTFIVVFIHLLNQFIDCFGEWFVFLLMFCLCSLWHSLFHATHYFMYSSGLFHLNMHLTFTLISLFYWYICWKDFSVHSCVCFLAFQYPIKRSNKWI